MKVAKIVTLFVMLAAMIVPSAAQAVFLKANGQTMSYWNEWNTEGYLEFGYVGWSGDAPECETLLHGIVYENSEEPLATSRSYFVGGLIGENPNYAEIGHYICGPSWYQGYWGLDTNADTIWSVSFEPNESNEGAVAKLTGREDVQFTVQKYSNPNSEEAPYESCDYVTKEMTDEIESFSETDLFSVVLEGEFEAGKECTYFFPKTTTARLHMTFHPGSNEGSMYLTQ